MGGTVGGPLGALIGGRLELPVDIEMRFPELAAARWRRGGVAPRVAGWFLGVRSVAAVTLWRTVFVAAHVSLTEELLLHELRHVHQFQSDATFPLRYLWETVRHGYRQNRFEVDARDYAARRLREPS